LATEQSASLLSYGEGPLKNKNLIIYITHNNPIKAGLVTEPWEWKHSSARNYAEVEAVIEIDDIGFLG
jgi:hypothetical protein